MSFLHKLEAEPWRFDYFDVLRHLEREVGIQDAPPRRVGRERDLLVAVDVEAPSDPLLPRPILNPVQAQPDTEPWWRSLVKDLPLP